MEVLKKGTVESLLVAMRDRLGNIATLGDVTGLQFDTRRKSDNAACELAKPATFDVDYPMTAICPIDTTLLAYTAGDDFKLYIRYTAGTENPLKGPIFFRVEDD